LNSCEVSSMGDDSEEIQVNIVQSCQRRSRSVIVQQDSNVVEDNEDNDERRLDATRRERYL
jgi:hypothetical protein